jgi:hypothetical protein
LRDIRKNKGLESTVPALVARAYVEDEQFKADENEAMLNVVVEPLNQRLEILRSEPQSTKNDKEIIQIEKSISEALNSIRAVDTSVLGLARGKGRKSRKGRKISKARKSSKAKTRTRINKRTKNGGKCKKHRGTHRRRK